jgi:hypothetical protein
MTFLILMLGNVKVQPWYNRLKGTSTLRGVPYLDVGPISGGVVALVEVV